MLIDQKIKLVFQPETQNYISNIQDDEGFSSDPQSQKAVYA